jgi:broad specificity phosphatase PhoE
MNRWRGEIDVPLTELGRNGAIYLGAQLEEKEPKLLMVYHDWLSRCWDTAKAVCPVTAQVNYGCRPWRMGPAFEGNPITAESVRHAQWFAEHPHERPNGGEPFGDWYTEWLSWLNGIADITDSPVGVVTHNRNIQAVYSTVEGKFVPDLYNVPGPTFLSVHEYRHRQIAPWDGGVLVRRGVYLIRHGETEWGT